MGMAMKALFGGRVTLKSVQKVEEGTFVRVDEPLKAYTSFAWRLALSAVIATGGIAVSSPAVIIGAMLIAPLMSPMLGTTFALVASNWRGFVRTIIITALGVAGCLLISMAFAAIMPVDVDPSTNSEIVSRTSPRIADLIIALASGLMGSISMMRDDIPDAMSGVAISAAIVPPLCAAGISLYAGDIRSAFGAMNLFMVNYFAIQATSLIVFVIAELERRVRSGEEKMPGRARAIMFAAILVGVLTVSVPLAFASLDIVNENDRHNAVGEIVRDWAEDDGYRITGLDFRDDEVSIEIAGEGPAPEARDLRDALDDRGFADERIRVIVEHEETF